MWVNTTKLAPFPGIIASTFAVPSSNNVLRHWMRALADASQAAFAP
jgi:hypothetical protein